MTLLSTFTNLILHIKNKTDVKNIVIYDQEENTEIFQKVRYIEGSVTDDLKMMEHPKEDGTAIVDHVIHDIKTAAITLIIEDNDIDSLDEILDYYLNHRPVIIKIKTKYIQILLCQENL